MIIFRIVLALGLMLLSACVSHNSKNDLQHDSKQVNSEARDKINALIMRCALPVIYYGWQVDKEYTFSWQTSRNRINVRSSVLQPCIDRSYATRSFYFRRGLTGKVNISVR